MSFKSIKLCFKSYNPRRLGAVVGGGTLGRGTPGGGGSDGGGSDVFGGIG